MIGSNPAHHPLVRYLNEGEILRYESIHRNYSPTQLANHGYLIDFSQPAGNYKDTAKTTVVVPGDLIACASNQFGNATYDFPQATQPWRPSYTANVWNGLGGAFFQTDDILVCPNGFPWTGGGFFWLVVKPTTVSGAYQRIASFRTPVDSDFNQPDTLLAVRAPSAGNPFLFELNEAAPDKLTFTSTLGSTNNIAYYIWCYWTGGLGTFHMTGMSPDLTDAYTNIDPYPSYMTIGAQMLAGGFQQENYEGYVLEAGGVFGPQNPILLVAHHFYILNKWGLA